MFHRFRQPKFAYGGSILSSSQFLLLPQLPQKTALTSKLVKIDSKIISCNQRSNLLKLTGGYKMSFLFHMSSSVKALVKTVKRAPKIINKFGN